MIELLTTDPVCLPSPCSPHSWVFPLLLVWWSIGLVAVALAFACDLVLRARSVRSTLARLTRSLKAIGVPKGQSMSRAHFEKVGNLLRSNSFTLEGWDEFEETLLHEEKPGGGEATTFNTRPASDFFPYSQIEQRIPQIHRSVPAILTSLGLLGTFLALLIGLHGVHVDEQLAPPAIPNVSSIARAPDVGTSEQPTAMKPAVTGINALVNSLSGKFLSSIVALMLAVLYTFAESVLFRSASQRHHQFCVAFDGVFVRRTSEALLQRIHREIESQSASFRVFNADLSGHLKQSFQESLGPTLSRLADALERMSSSTEERIAELIGSLAERFHSGLRESAGSEFQQLAASLKQTVGLLETVNSGSRSTQEGLGQLLIRLDASHQRQIETLDAQKRMNEEVLAAVTQQVEGVTSRSAAGFDQTISRILEQTVNASSETSAKLTSVLTDHARLFEDRMGALLARLDTIVAEMSRSAQSGSDQLAVTVGEVARRLDEAMVAAANTVNGAAAGVVQQTGSVSTELYRRVQEVLDRQERQVGAADQARESLEAATARVRTLMEDSAAAFGQFRPLVSDLSSAANNLRAAGEASRGAQEELRKVSHSLEGQAKVFEQTSGHHSALLREYQAVFDRIQQGLGTVLQQLADSMQRYHEASRTSLKGHLQDFDEHLGTVTRKIKGSVDELGEGLQDLMEAIDSAAAKIAPDGKRG